MTITQLQYIVAVDTYRHFGRAAKACFVSQPTLSMQIQKLEEELGEVLFDRSRSPILPTSLGVKIINQARTVLREHRKIKEIIEIQGQAVEGQFHLAIIPTVSPYLLPLFLKSFVQSYPKVEIIIEELTTEEIINRLENDQIDAALMATPLGNDHLIERSLYFEKFQVFSSPDHPISKDSKVDESELSGEGLWLLSEGHCLRDQVMRVCRLRKDPKRRVHFASGNLETLKNLVVANSGYTLLPELTCLRLTDQEKKWLKPFKGKAPAREISLVHSRSFLKEKILDALQGCIVLNLPKELESHKKSKLKVLKV